MPAVTLQPGAVVGKYRIEKKLGEGTMGEVFEARHLLLGRTVAIKVLRPQLSDRPNAVQRFVNEARAAAALDHVNIIDVADVDELPGGRLYMILEHLQGETLADYIERSGAIAPQAAAEILDPICSAIDAAHARGIIHRDLKPSNLFLALRAGERVLKVLDFGVARLQTADIQPITQSGAILGTPAYMSPEQALGKNRRVGPRSDIYSIGVIAFELLAGRLPFTGGPGELIVQHAQHPPPSLSEVVPGIPEGLERVVRRALEKRPRDRWSSAGGFMRAFRLALDPSRARELQAMFDPRTSSGEETRPDVRHRVGRRALGGVFAAVIVVAALLAVAVARRHQRSRPPAPLAAIAPSSPPPHIVATSQPRSPVSPASSERAGRPVTPAIPARTRSRSRMFVPPQTRDVGSPEPP